MLQAATRLDCSAEGFGWLEVRAGFVGIAPAVIMSVSYSGEQAFEIHVPNGQLHAAYLALRDAGAEHGLRLFGSMAVESMRMEKGYLHWKLDLITEFNPFETGLGRFVDMNKEFVGKPALQEMVEAGPRKLLVPLAIDCDHAPSHGGASVYDGDNLVGTVTSAAWGYRVGRNLAYAFVEPDCAAAGTALKVDVTGQAAGRSGDRAVTLRPGTSPRQVIRPVLVTTGLAGPSRRGGRIYHPCHPEAGSLASGCAACIGRRSPGEGRSRQPVPASIRTRRARPR